MARLAIDQAPTVSLPRRFLLTAPLWGAVGGVLLLIDGHTALVTRWQPQTIALVHVFTLGVFGNAMLGSLLQFLPAAAAVRVHGTARYAPVLHGMFNLGVVLLVTGLHMMWAPGLIMAAALLPACFLCMAAMTLPGLLTANGQRLLRAGIAVAIGFGVLASLLGGALALTLGGWVYVPLAALADIHASWSVLGWVVVLLASVARVVMPMFQGTAMVRGSVQATWLGSLSVMLAWAAWQRYAHHTPVWLVATVTVYASLFAAAALWLQWRARALRRKALVRSWRYGLAALLLGAWVLPVDPCGGLLAGVLGIGLALPLLMVGMGLEIVAFLGWIELHRHCGRGTRLPGVQHLLPETEKERAALALLPCALLAAAAVYWPSPWLARGAGAAVTIAWLMLWHAMHGVERRVRFFVHTQENCR